MMNFTLVITDEFNVIFKESFESLSEASDRAEDWLGWNESGETPLASLVVLEGSRIAKTWL